MHAYDVFIASGFSTSTLVDREVNAPRQYLLTKSEEIASIFSMYAAVSTKRIHAAAHWERDGAMPDARCTISTEGLITTALTETARGERLLRTGVYDVVQ